MSKAKAILFLALAWVALSAGAVAGIWPEMGDAQTRSDIEIAAAHGLIDNITTQGPQPWTGILGQLRNVDDNAVLPAEVREAAARLLVQGKSDLELHRPHLSVSIDVTNDPAVVRGYDALGRSETEGQVTYEYLATSTAVHLSVGVRTNSGRVASAELKSGAHVDLGRDRQRLVLDGSYIAQRLDDIVVYGGWRSHWWGPGWISALTLSSNARPMPQIGFTRINSRQSDTWLLHWLGPWQIEGFIGLLDGQRVARNTGYVAMHFAFNPLPGLEIGLSRTTELCGTGHPCQPVASYFTFSNDPQHLNQSNDEASIDLRYTNTVFSHAFAVYAQFMNEDTNPIVNSSTSRLYGGTVWLPFQGLTGRLTLEYANSIATKNIWGGPTQYGISYNNYQYQDGMRYRGRSLGFSLDGDSVLYSAQASAIDSGGRTYTLTYHRALVSSPLSPAVDPKNTPMPNAVTSAPVRFNAVELRTALPLKWAEWGRFHAKVDIAARWQDDQPRPRHGGEATLEIALRLGI